MAYVYGSSHVVINARRLTVQASTTVYSQVGGYSGMQLSELEKRREREKINFTAVKPGLSYSRARRTNHCNTALHLHLSRSLVDRWGATDDLATSSLHSSRLSAFLMAAPSVMPVHSGMLSSHLLFCLPLSLPPCTVPCMIVLACPEDLVTCSYRFSLRRFTVVKRSLWGPMAGRVLFRTSSLEMRSL